MGHRRESPSKSGTLANASVGVGLRADHYREALEAPAAVDFLEVHSENFFAEAGIAVELLQDVAVQTPISLHGTSAGLGSVEPVPGDYLMKLKRLADRTNPVLVSDHLCFTWARIGGRLFHGGDLLPIPYTRESLDHVVRNIDRTQSYLGRQIAVENVCAYISFEDRDFDEAEFLNQIVSRTGCGLILDINNLMVNARNAGHQDAGDQIARYLRSINEDAIVEIHLAGSTPVNETEVLIDDHACPVSTAGWEIYHSVIAAIGPRPTLIEWDNNLPSWAALLNEADKARRVQKSLLPQGVQP